MKKKILTIAVVVALIAIMVSGTLAYFTAEDKVDNTFTIGSVKIEIFENDKETIDDVNPLGQLIPVVNADPSADDSYIDKVVEVKNTGANDAYIRTYIAIPTKLVGYLYLDLTETGWTRLQPDTAANVGGVDYTVFAYDFNTAVKPGEFTNELLQGVYLNSDVDLEENADGHLEFIRRDLQTGDKIHDSDFIAHTKNADGTYTSTTVNILVASQAIQTAGFENAKSALESGFGTETNPWMP